MIYSKEELLERIIKLADLPPGGQANGFFTKKQILALYLHLQRSADLKKKLQERQVMDVNT